MLTVKIERFIRATPSEVYHYFTNSTALRDWMCEVATVQPYPGGHIYLCWPGDYYSSGEFTQLEDNKRVSFTWLGRGEPRPTKVDVSLKKQKDGTLIKLAHRGIGKGKKWETIRDTYEKEWHSSLDNLASVLETGADLRITRRPMLGITVGEFNPDIATQLGVPVEFGIRLEGVIEGMGAQHVGLQKDDVIVAMDGKDLSPSFSLAHILRSKHAGDVIEITFYRGSDKKTSQMTLSGRRIPPNTSSGAELAHQIEPIYRQFEEEIEHLLNNASEEECSHKPDAGEWSVDEIIAHLIHSELEWQNNATEIITGHEPAYDDFGGNLQARIDGTTSVFKTKDGLLQELKHHDAESLAMFAHLPDDLVTHKGRFWKLSFLADQNSYHLQTHLEQMRAAIQSARM